ncbi:MAG: MBL fold metallo-hydrolase [Bacteroidetes bacterium]|nr:MAG: MBL fold metallo-hydrolase [Bacteroidota bacterium]
METRVLSFGSLMVSAAEMFNGLLPDRIRKYYKLDPGGNLRIGMNGMLVEAGERVVLFDPGCADFLPSRFAEAYGLQIPVPVDEVIKKSGYSPERVTDVIFTHLHYDHGTGAFRRVPGKIVKRFTNAAYHVLKEHYSYASSPRKVEKNSFFFSFFRNVDRLCWLEDWEGTWMQFRVYDGHTERMVVPSVQTPHGKIHYVSDLVPMEIFLEPDVSSVYDLDPQQAIRDKLDFLGRVEKPAKLILYHDLVQSTVVVE